ncbi:MAG: cell envelope integrity EipB family protein [Phyllobacterium sp.]
MRYVYTLMSGLGLVVWPVYEQAAAASTLKPHRAIYDLQLDRADQKSGITGLTGRMVYEFNGSACEGYTTNFRFVTKIDMDEQPQRITDQQTTTFESGNGDMFRFVNKTFVDQNLSKEVRGNARLEKNSTDVTLKVPEENSIKLERSQFPTRHMEELIGKASKGEAFYQTTLFDASEDADRVMATTVVIGKQQDAPSDSETKSMGTLGSEKSWPVSIAYFDDEENNEGLPTYRVNFKLYRNGVTRALKMDYGDFSMTGTLVGLQMYDAPKPCK